MVEGKKYEEERHEHICKKYHVLIDRYTKSNLKIIIIIILLINKYKFNMM